MAEGTEEALSERAQLLLKALIESYIRDGQPVGSRTLSRDSGLSLSSATIRNVMADLEELGFVVSPHTSAGRIPTDKGYRLFVDSLLKLKPLQSEEIDDIERRLRSDAASNGRALVQTVSQMLSSVTQMAGLVTLPNPHYVALSQIEFIGLSENRALAIMVMNNREVENRVVQLERAYSSEELRRAANYLNEPFAGRSLPEVRASLLKQLQETRQTMNQLMQDAIQMAQKVFETPAQDRVEYVIAGETNLMGFAELRTSTGCGGCSRPSTRSTTCCGSSTTACGPRGSRSSSARSRATRSSTTSASSPPPTCSTTRWSGFWGSSARRAWPMSASSRSSMLLQNSSARP